MAVTPDSPDIPNLDALRGEISDDLLAKTLGETVETIRKIPPEVMEELKKVLNELAKQGRPVADAIGLWKATAEAYLDRGLKDTGYLAETVGEYLTTLNITDPETQERYIKAFSDAVEQAKKNPEVFLNQMMEMYHEQPAFVQGFGPVAALGLVYSLYQSVFGEGSFLGSVAGTVVAAVGVGAFVHYTNDGNENGPEGAENAPGRG